jgi:hypothetical protein
MSRVILKTLKSLKLEYPVSDEKRRKVLAGFRRSLAG